ncbi:unnamed protein product [Chrysoparadoxa australica]
MVLLLRVLLCCLAGSIFAPLSIVQALDSIASLFTGRVTVQTENGPVEGSATTKGHAFLGIPYGKPPVGERRFRPPEPADPWDKKLSALEFGPECAQSSERSLDAPAKQSEDCLYLNIWTPPGASKQSYYPVMLWIYGGGFQQGATSHPEYHGARLAERGVVVITVNYRLGALGFLVSVDDDIWGNFGLQDQRLAMEWVNRNIESFGGDPSAVTLWGESAGAMSVVQHLMMDGAGTLFQSVIMQSNPFGYRYRSISVANFLGQAIKRGLDCTDLDCMQSEPLEEIIRVQEGLLGLPRSVGDFFTWGPVVTEGHEKYLVRHYNSSRPLMNVKQPLEFLSNPKKSKALVPMPVLLGCNQHEGQMFVHGAFPLSMPKMVYWAFVAALFKDSTRRVLAQYGDMANAQKESGDYRPVMSQIIHDYLFRCPNQRAAHRFQELSSAPVWMYEFRHPTVVPGFPACDGLACHTAELPYVFEQYEVIHQNYTFTPSLSPTALFNDGHDESEGGGKIHVCDLESSGSSTSAAHAASMVKSGQKWLKDKLHLSQHAKDNDTIVSELMAAYWTQFGKTGNPNSERSPKFWPEWRGRQRWREEIPNPNGDGTIVVEQVVKAPPDQPEQLGIEVNVHVDTAYRDCSCLFWDQLGWRY